MQKFIFQWNYSLFVAFAQHFQRFNGEVDRRFGESEQFGATHARLVEKLEEQLVAAAVEIVGKVHGIIYFRSFFLGEKDGQASGSLGGYNLGHNVDRDPLLTAEELEEGAQHSYLGAHAARLDPL